MTLTGFLLSILQAAAVDGVDLIRTLCSKVDLRARSRCRPGQILKSLVIAAVVVVGHKGLDLGFRNRLAGAESAILSPPRRHSSTTRILSPAQKCCRVARLMLVRTWDAGSSRDEFFFAP